MSILNNKYDNTSAELVYALKDKVGNLHEVQDKVARTEIDKMSDKIGNLNSTSVGLGNVDNTSDANKPISIAMQNALNTKLPLSGGQMSGPIRFGTGIFDDASLVLSGKPILADNAQNGGIANDYRYLYRFNSGIELGNHHMYLRLLTDNGAGKTGQSNGLSGDVWHYISSNNRINGTISKYIMLDTRNSSLTDIDYGHKLKLGYNEVNILGIGKLSPELTMPLNSTQLTLNIGGETSTVTVQNAISASSFTGSHYYTLDTTNTNKIVQVIGSKEGENNIILGPGLTAQKVAQEGKTISANPNTYNIEINLSENIINLLNQYETRIAQLEAIIQQNGLSPNSPETSENTVTNTATSIDIQTPPVTQTQEP